MTGLYTQDDHDRAAKMGGIISWLAPILSIIITAATVSTESKMPYPCPEDIRRAKRTMRWFILTCIILLCLFIELGFIFYLLLTS